MARASIPTKLSLAEWAKIMGVNPLHFESVVLPELANAHCDQGWFQYEWQDFDRIGREAVARAIAEAEDLIENWTNFRLAPTWEVQEWRTLQRPYHAEEWGGYGTTRDTRASFQTRWKHLISGGVMGSELVAAANVVTWSDADGDGYPETGTISVASDVTEPCELRLFVPGFGPEETHEIRPLLSRVISGGMATVSFRRELLVKDDRLQSIADPRPVDGHDDDAFYATVDLWRVWNDPSEQATLVWEPNGECGCGLGGCGSCSYSVSTACVVPRDHRLGIASYSPATWDVENAHWHMGGGWPSSYGPDMVRASYFAGWRDMTRPCSMYEMDERWKRMVAMLATSMLDRPGCSCVRDMFTYWQEDMAASSSSKQSGIWGIHDAMRNPFGTKRGAVYAWNRVTTMPGVPVASGYVNTIV